ncbi:hypothetical protein ACFQ1M_02870 [Sungkyunkwania multivorans]|uniref:PH domain-containing protein n=1 Tax=Sungkyunkwania multivorans TaxID=1173618 RepID=A0ABW3CWZ8_9FLAO
MEKQYRPTILYIFKIVGILLLTAVGFLFFDIGLSLVGVIIPGLALIVIRVIMLVCCLAAIILTLLRGIPSVVLKEHAIIIQGVPRKFSEIESFGRARGGSEPFFMLKDGRRIDVELSWFTKKDRLEIEKFIEEKVTKLSQ